VARGVDRQCNGSSTVAANKLAVQASGTKDCEETGKESWEAQLCSEQVLRARYANTHQQRSGRDLDSQEGRAKVVCMAKCCVQKGAYTA